MFILVATPKTEQPLPEVQVEKKTVAQPEGKEVKPTPQPQPKPQPSNPGDLSCGKSNSRDYVSQKATQISLQWQIAYAVVRQESNWSCTPGTDGAGSYGLWQINLPAHPNISWDCAHDLVCSTNWAVPHLKYLIDTYGLRNGLAAYNAGVGGMRAGNGFIYADEVTHRISNNVF